MTKSRGHVEFIDGHEYYKSDGLLYRAESSKPLVGGKRLGQFVTSGSGIDFALRMARLKAGQAER